MEYRHSRGKFESRHLVEIQGERLYHNKEQKTNQKYNKRRLFHASKSVIYNLDEFDKDFEWICDLRLICHFPLWGTGKT